MAANQKTESRLPDMTTLPSGRVILAAASARSLAAAAIRLGLSPVCLDFFADADLLQLLDDCGGQYLRQLSSFSQLPSALQDVDPAVPVLCGGGIENAPAVLAELSSQRRVLNASPEAVQTVRDVVPFFDALRRDGVRIPRTARSWFESPHGLLAKPLRSCGGIGIISQPQTMTQAGGDFVFQEFVAGAAVSVVCLSDRRHVVHVLGSSLQAVGLKGLGGSGFQYCGALGRIPLPTALNEQAERIAKAVVDSSRLCGVFGMDLILQRGELWLIEINPRLTATHTVCTRQPHEVLRQHLSVWGVQPMRQDREQGLQQDADDALSGPRVAELIVYAKHDVEVSDEDFLPAKLWDVRPVDSGEPPPQIAYADVPAAAQPIPAGSPLCTIIVRLADWRQLPAVLQTADLPERLQPHVHQSLLAREVESAFRQLAREAC